MMNDQYYPHHHSGRTCRHRSNSLTICGYAGRRTPRHSPTLRSRPPPRKQKSAIPLAASGNLVRVPHPASARVGSYDRILPKLALAPENGLPTASGHARSSLSRVTRLPDLPTAGGRRPGKSPLPSVSAIFFVPYVLPSHLPRRTPPHPASRPPPRSRRNRLDEHGHR